MEEEVLFFRNYLLAHPELSKKLGILNPEIFVSFLDEGSLDWWFQIFKGSFYDWGQVTQRQMFFEKNPHHPLLSYFTVSEGPLWAYLHQPQIPRPQILNDSVDWTLLLESK